MAQALTIIDWGVFGITISQVKWFFGQSALRATKEDVGRDYHQSYRILIIDDDFQLSRQMKELFEGLSVSAANMELRPSVELLDVQVEKKPGDDKWTIGGQTVARMRELQKAAPFDLVVIDYGYVDAAVKKQLELSAQEKQKSKDSLQPADVQGRVLTPLDLKQASDQAGLGPGVFATTGQVMLRSFVSKKFLVALPRFEERLAHVRKVFPKARNYIAVNTTEELFGGEKFYHIYELGGRDFYRQLCRSYESRIVEREMYRLIAERAVRMRIRRTVLNVSLFAGTVSALGLVCQSLIGQGFAMLRLRYWFWGAATLAAGLLMLPLGALVPAVWFESISRWLMAIIEPDRDD